MKTLRSLALGALLLVSITSSATILTCNNATPSPGQHNTIGAAVAAALTGDTIMVAGTDVSYGNVTLDKPLTILGPGWVVSGGGISRVAIFGNITITTNNTRLIGLRAINVLSGAASLGTISGVVVQRCIIDVAIELNDDDWTGALIEGNVFSTWNNYVITSSHTNYDFLNCEIRNNIIMGIIYSAENCNVSHNLFLSAGGVTSIAAAMTTSSFTGNIVVGRNISTATGTNNVSGNLSWGGSGAWVSGGNITDVNPLFVNYPTAVQHGWSFDYHLGVSSPALGTGPSGEDVGIYDGDGVYRQDGEPSIPIVRAVNVPGGAVVPANATFNVNIISVAHE